MDYEPGEDAESKRLKEEISRRSDENPQVCSAVGDYPIRNYRLSPKEVMLLIQALGGLPHREEYKKIADSLRNQQRRWEEYQRECEARFEETDFSFTGI